MASSSGTSSGTYTFQSSASEEDLQKLMDEKKRKRMTSNRESARRSRVRKQKKMDDLMAQLAQLKNENNQLLATMNVTNQHYLNVDVENSILKARVVDLSQRLESLNGTINFLNGTINLLSVNDYNEFTNDGVMMNPSWNYLYPNYQPIMTADMHIQGSDQFMGSVF